MKLKYSFFILLFFPTGYISADTLVENLTVTESQVWTQENSPFVIKGEVIVPKGIVLSIQKGTVLNFVEGKMNIQGELHVLGSKDRPVKITQDGSSSGFFLDNGILDSNYVNLTGGRAIIDAANKSKVTFNNLDMKDMVGYGSVMTIRDESSLILKDSSVINISAPIGINIYDDSQVDIEDSIFKNVGSNTIISCHGKKDRGSKVSVLRSTFNDSINAFEIYEQSYLDIKNSFIDNMSDAGVRMYGLSTSSIAESRISLNNTGIQSAESFLTVTDSVIEKNIEYGIYRIAGSFVDSNNIFDPNQKNLFLPKRVIFLEGDEKDNATTSMCCSNVLFLPGIEASRLYKKHIAGENQLWEPNINGDVIKLYLDKNGNSVYKNIYTRDYINKTNVGAGIFDKEIYLKFTVFLNNLQSNRVINDWTGYPYDWRKDPVSIATQDQSIESGFINLLSEVENLASSSKNKKVTIIGHSYGGVVTKYFLKYLHEIGKDNLIDNIILVAVPESGTVASVGAMLHGDDQEIAGGFMLNSETARGLSQNMPSVYYLLPNHDLINYLNQGIIKMEGGKWFDSYPGFKIFNEKDFADFLLNTKKNRPYTRSVSDLRLPLRLNKLLFDNMSDTRKSIDNFNYSNIPIRIFNVIGTGIDTVHSYMYYKNSCDDSVVALIQKYSDKYCGFTHDEGYTNKGDGTVLVGDIAKRWGSKYFFNMSKYNADNQTNYTHADIVSADPIQHLIELIIRNDNLDNLPNYMSQDYGPDPDDRYEYSIDEGLEMEATDELGDITGYIDRIELRKIRLIKSSIPNTRYKKVGNKNKLVTKKRVKKIKLIPVIKTKKPKTVKFFTLKSKKIKGDEQEDEFIFEEVPVTPESKIEVELSASSTLPAVIHIDLFGDGSIVDIPPSYPRATTSQELIDIHELIIRTIQEIQISNIRLALKNRYILRLRNIDKWFLKNKIVYSYLLSSRERDSLSSITKELYKAKPRYYRGTLNLDDTFFLWPKFEKITNALKRSI